LVARLFSFSDVQSESLIIFCIEYYNISKYNVRKLNFEKYIKTNCYKVEFSVFTDDVNAFCYVLPIWSMLRCFYMLKYWTDFLSFLFVFSSDTNMTKVDPISNHRKVPLMYNVERLSDISVYIDL